MKNSLRVLVVVLLSILLAVYLSTCVDSGGEGEATTDRSAEFVQLMVDLDNEGLQGQVSDEEFIMQYSNILDQIDNAPNGPVLFQEYLETEILGYDFIQSSVSKISNFSDDDSALDIINRFIENIILCATPVPLGELICIASKTQITTIILSTQVRTQIYDAYFLSDPIKYQELMAIWRRNPAEAKKQLHIALGESIPDNFKSVPPGCFRNCDDAWLGVAVSPIGGGTVTGPGINYPGDGTEIYPMDTTFTLTPSPADGFYFMGWTGVNCGRGPCEITMDADKAIVAHFSNMLTWTFNVSWSTSRASGDCTHDANLLLSGQNTQSAPCGDANITFSTTRNSVSVSGLGNTTGTISIMSYNCNGSGGGTGGITETLNGFSAGGGISGSSNCVITNSYTGDVTTESLTVTGSWSAHAPKEWP